MKKIAIATDHRGLGFKNNLKNYLEEKGYEVKDFGCHTEDSCDYPDFIFPAAEELGKGNCDLAIGICYTGIGSSIAANKVNGVRASLCEDAERAKLTRGHNDSNMLIVASGFHSEEELFKIVQVWLETPFEGGRHEGRIGKIKEYERNHVSLS